MSEISANNREDDSVGRNIRDGFYRFLLSQLVEYPYGEEEARDQYYQILEHRVQLSRKLKRDVGLRVAALDFLSNVKSCLKNPYFLEYDRYSELIGEGGEGHSVPHLDLDSALRLVSLEISRSTRSKHPFSIALIEMDDYENLVSAYSPDILELWREHFARNIREQLRSIDTFAVLSDRLFFILMPFAPDGGARIAGRRIHSRYTESFVRFQQPESLPLIEYSVGVASFPDGSMDENGLFEQAQEALKVSRLEKSRPNRMEKRLYSRYRPLEALEIVFEGAESSFRARVMDLSTGGVRLEFSKGDAEKAENQTIWSGMMFECGGNPLLHCSGAARCVRNEEFSENKNRALAFAFQNPIETLQWMRLEEGAGLYPYDSWAC